MPMYEYIHPDTGQVYEEIRNFKDKYKVYIAPDGKECKALEVPSQVHGWKGDKEVFEVDSDYVKKCNPKYVKFRDGHRERYDPTKHC